VEINFEPERKLGFFAADEINVVKSLLIFLDGVMEFFLFEIFDSKLAIVREDTRKVFTFVEKSSSIGLSFFDKEANLKIVFVGLGGQSEIAYFQVDGTARFKPEVFNEEFLS